MRIILFLLTVLCLGATYSCENTNANEGGETAILPLKDTTAVDSVEVIVPEPFNMSYSFVSPLDSIYPMDSLSEEEIQMVLVLNRIDRKYLMSKDSIVVPDSLIADLDYYCPFPQIVDSLEKIDKIIYVSRFAQAFAVYEKGKRMKWGPVSTGKEATQTPSGLFSTNWKSKRNISSVNSSWILNWSFNISNHSGVSLHEYALPGRPASHSCVRMYAKDAEWVYYWADQWVMGADQQIDAFGTPVVIFGDYPFDGQRPWLRIVENPDVLNISQERLMLETEPFAQKIWERQEARFWVLKKKEIEEEVIEAETPVI